MTMDEMRQHLAWISDLTSVDGRLTPLRLGQLPPPDTLERHKST